MNEHERQFDEQSDGRLDMNLRAIGRRVERPADATDEQIHRWVKLAQAAPRKRTVLRFPALAGPALRRWALSAAAVAVLAAGLFLAFRTTPQPVSAEDVFQRVGSTLAENPVLHLTIQGVELHGNHLDFEFLGAEQGRAIFAHVDARSSAESDHTLGLNLTLARDGEAGWVLVRRLQWNRHDPMGRLIPDGGALLIDVPVSRSTDQAVRQMFPVAVRPREVQALIESLRQAVPDLTVRELADGTVLLEGVITRPENLDLRMLCETTDAARIAMGVSPALMTGMTKRDLQKVVKTLKTSLAERMSKEDFQAVSQRLDMISFVAMQQLQSGETEQRIESSERFDKNLRTLLTGATIAIAYDPAQKLLRSVSMDNVGPARGTVRLRFDEPEINQAMLDRTRFTEKPNTRIMTRDEVICAMLLPLLSPTPMEPAEGN
ncbi:MAG: hypothetical protein JW849_10885 [Phycisphaerae bacterium]|nr:hypothetical protein [Phycisphaerae bacterium]